MSTSVERTPAKKSPIPEKIPERRIIVYKTCIDPTVMKLAVEKMKKELFLKAGFLKPKPEEIQYVSMDKHYEPYIFVDGKYSVEYYRKHIFTLEVDEDTQEVIVFNHRLKPQPMMEHGKGAYGTIKLEAEKHFLYQNKASFIIDKTGREVEFEQLSFAPSEDDPKKILAEFSEKTGKLEAHADKEVELLRLKVVKRPSNADRITAEEFEVSERAVIYAPIYEITFQNVRTGEKKTVKIDGVTAKVLP